MTPPTTLSPPTLTTCPSRCCTTTRPAGIPITSSTDDYAEDDKSLTTSALLMMTIPLQGLPTVSADTWQLDLGNLSLQPAGGTSVKTVQQIEQTIIQPIEYFAELCSWENKVARLEKKRGGVCMF